MNSNRLSEMGAGVLGVSHDSVESHQAFAKSLTLGFPLVSDVDKSITRSYGVKGFFGRPMRVTFVVDKSGIIRSAYKNSSDLHGHVDQAIRKIQELTAP